MPVLMIAATSGNSIGRIYDLSGCHTNGKPSGSCSRCTETISAHRMMTNSPSCVSANAVQLSTQSPQFM